MAKIPQVMRSIAEPNIQSPSISQAQFSNDNGIAQAISFAGEATAQYAINEKKQFDLARLTEARNILDVRETQLASDEKNGWQNKLGQNAVLFKDEDGNDFMGHYSNKFQDAIRDTETQLQLTPDQKKIFNTYAQEKATGFYNQLQTHQMRQGKEYKVSVFENAIDIAKKKAEGQFTNVDEMNKSIEQMTADINALGNELGWSKVEIDNKTANSVNGVHGANLTAILKSGDFMTGEAYLKQYGSNMSELQKMAASTEVRKMQDDYRAAQIISIEDAAMTGGSNPAFNSNDNNLIKATAKIDPREFGSLSFSDPRLDSLAVVNAKDLKMDWAIPIVTALRVAGEKSNNGETSPKSARGVYQFTPIAIEQVRRITGKTIDPTNPEEATWGALQFVKWISEKYDTQDPAIIASYYNGGGNHIPQMKAGGVNAIKNNENRNYVKRILNFDFKEYASKPVAQNGLNFDLSAITPENQAKVLANRDRIKRQQKAAETERQDKAYENASDMIWTGQASFDQIKANPSIVKFLDNRQLTALQALDKSIKTGSSASLVAKVYQNPTELKGMPQSQFNTMISFVGDSEKKELSKMYAEANGRTIKDLNAENDAQKSKSVVSNKMVFDIVEDYAPSLGFSGTMKSNKKVQNSNTDSSMFMAIKDNLYGSVVAADNRVFSQTGKHMSEFQVRNFVKSELNRTKAVPDGGTFSSKTKQVSVYSAATSRDIVNEKTNQQILNMAIRSGGNYKDVSSIPDSLYWQYYYKAWRRN